MLCEFRHHLRRDECILGLVPSTGYHIVSQHRPPCSQRSLALAAHRWRTTLLFVAQKKTFLKLELLVLPYSAVDCVSFCQGHRMKSSQPNQWYYSGICNPSTFVIEDIKGRLLTKDGSICSWGRQTTLKKKAFLVYVRTELVTGVCSADPTHFN